MGKSEILFRCKRAIHDANAHDPPPITSPLIQRPISISPVSPLVTLVTPIPEVEAALAVEEFLLPPGQTAPHVQPPSQPATAPGETQNGHTLLSSIYGFQGVGFNENVQK
jgi:hypothetical protein